MFALVPAENIDDLVAFINGSGSKGSGKSKKKKKRKKKKRSSKRKEIEDETKCTGERKEQSSSSRDERADRAERASAARHAAAAPAQQIKKQPPEIPPPIPLADKSSILVKETSAWCREWLCGDW